MKSFITIRNMCSEVLMEKIHTLNCSIQDDNDICQITKDIILTFEERFKLIHKLLKDGFSVESMDLLRSVLEDCLTSVLINDNEKIRTAYIKLNGLISPKEVRKLIDKDAKRLLDMFVKDLESTNETLGEIYTVFCKFVHTTPYKTYVYSLQLDENISSDTRKLMYLYISNSAFLIMAICINAMRKLLKQDVVIDEGQIICSYYFFIVMLSMIIYTDNLLELNRYGEKLCVKENEIWFSKQKTDLIEQIESMKQNMQEFVEAINKIFRFSDKVFCEKGKSKIFIRETKHIIDNVKVRLNIECNHTK